jgi:predicted flap endonuclease-1-like 5' DNA nuclease
MSLNRGIAVWLSGFATFLAILSSVSIALLLITEGQGAIVRPYLIGDLIGDLSVELYLWISVVTTFILMGITCLIAYRKQAPDPEIIKMLLKVGGNLAALRKTQEASTTEIAEQIDYSRKVNGKFFGKVSSDIEEAGKSTIAQFENQDKNIKKTRKDLNSALEKISNEVMEKIITDLKKQEIALIGIRHLSEEDSTTLKNQQQEFDEIKNRLETIEENMVFSAKAKLKSYDNPEEIKGIGPALGKELKDIGIESVGDLLTTDAITIGENTRVSQEMAENLQAMAQLMMIPGIDANDAELLIESGIKTRKELATQDLMQLSRKISEKAKIFLDQNKISNDEYPTIEEISSWIRIAK